MKRILTIVICACALFTAGLSRAQNLYEGNPANPYLLESAFSNPALNAFITNRAVLAMTAHQVGVGGSLLSIRSGVISYHLPWQMRGFAVGGQFFVAGLYSQSDFRVSYGKQIIPQLSAGANLDIFSRAFDKNRFFKFDDRDPVFANGYGKINASLGFGLLVEPYRTLSIGFSFEHANQPDLALGNDPFVQPLLFALGVRWRFPTFNVSSSINRLQMDDYSKSAANTAMSDMGQAAQYSAEVPFGRSWFRFAADPSNVQLEAEVPLYRYLYVNYRYGYPLTDINLASIGTQRFGFVYDFNRLPPLSPVPALPTLPRNQIELPEFKAVPRGQFFLYANADSVDVVQLRVHRSVEPGVPQQSLSILSPEDLGRYKKAPGTRGSRESDLLKVRDPVVRPKEFYSTKYRGALEGIGLQARRPESQVKAEIISYPGAERRANALANLLTGDQLALPSKVPIFTTNTVPGTSAQSEEIAKVADEMQHLITPEGVTFRAVPIFRSFIGCHWTLDVRNAREMPVFEFSGMNQPPDSLVWNWQDSQGNIVPPGNYHYQLRVTDSKGKVDYSDRGTLDVVHHHQSLSIDVTRKSKVGQVPADKYILIVGGGRPLLESLPADTTLGR